jgi:tetratricopeptide (TPR) repeat protein
LEALKIGVVVVCLMASSVAVAAPDGPAPKQDAPDTYSVVLTAANSAYNDGKYDEAIRGFVQAIQSRPERPVPYRNLARTYFWQSNYAAAVAYYDMYIRLATDAEDKEQVQSERRLASSRAGDKLWTTPESQRQALEALEDQLEGGTTYSSGGGGAWGLYRALMRSGYAQPDLTRIRRRLVSNLLDEFEGTFVAEASQPAPRLDLDGWELQQERLEAARKLSRDEAMLGVIERRAKVVDAGLALLNGQYEEAAERAGTALEQNPDMGFVRWLQISALVESGQHDEALEAVDELAKHLAQSRPNQLGYAKILRASILQRVGRGDDAADLYLGLVGK